MRAAGVSCAFSAMAPSAAVHSSTSKRLAGISTPFEGSSMRWLARPMRCSSREAPFGAPTLITRSTSPQSMPRSSEEVATTARRRPGRHRGLDLAALRDIERAVMQRDGEVVVVDAPQLLEDALGLAAGVDEHQRGLVALDQAVDFVDRVVRRMPGPRQPLGGVEHAHVGRGAGVRQHQIGERRAVLRAAAPDSGADRPARRPSPRGRRW